MREIATFGAIGAAAAAAYAALASVLTHLLGISALPATAIAYLAILPAAYAGQHGWTFRSARPHGSAFPRYAAVQGAGFAAAMALAALAGPRPSFLAYAGIGLAAGAASFLAQKLWVFASRP